MVQHVCMLVVLKAPLICFVVNKMMQKNTSAGILIALEHAIALAKGKALKGQVKPNRFWKN